MHLLAKAFYNGRWLVAPNQLSVEASFPGSNFEFAVSNTSTVALVLANTAVDRRARQRDVHNAQKSSLLLTPTQLKHEPADPVDILVTINSTKPTYYERSHMLEQITYNLEPNNVHRFKVTLFDSAEPSTLQLRGILMKEGGLLFHPDGVTGLVLQAKNHANSNESHTSASKRQASRIQRKLVEVVAPSSMMSEACRRNDTKIKTWSKTMPWTGLLQGYFSSSSLSTIPVSPTTCMTQQCHNQRVVKDLGGQGTAQDIFFRAGAPGTHLYDRLWPFGSSKESPAALVLMLGLADVEAFLRSSSVTKHQITQFTDEFARTYSSFIQTIRRTAYSPATMANKQAFGQMALQDEIDESYLYNSSPSTIPILLVLQPILSSLLHPQSRQLKSLLHHATSKVLNELKWHIGDKHTFVIDTDGWLDDADFGARSPTGDNDIAAFELTQSGHIKFAHHMALHLCHYLVDRDAGTSSCPFDRHNEYTGNLYVPETAGVGKLLEEKKIARIKEIYGVEG
ncbi:hypothetical protein OHC33_009601 [Knufia fluminis]|uniref:Uncharacterized protein n=1 Tax=Knufia fluminis TaxID=191047 RepID=A0AAN8I1N1_9EURO|nr:hypothetical protein OHC33_009601 [Knufia fluminis]